jgi:glycosyltransferase involved in cell wall biosynthesis
MDTIVMVPTISVIMPVYNGEKYLREAIDSILNQTYRDFEFIILNDGSTDSTEEIILSYDDPRIVYVKNKENLQIVKTLNQGIALAKGKYIARMDADDISLPRRFEKQIALMTARPDIDVCGTWYKTFGEKEYLQKLPTQDEQIKVDLLFYTSLAHPSIMMKKSIFDECKYSENFPKAEDYALWIELADKFKFANIPESLLHYRLHQNQTGTEYCDMQKESSLKALSVLLNKFDSNISQASINVHEHLFLKQRVPLEIVERWLKDIIKINSNMHFFDDKSLTKSLFQIWMIQAFSQTANGMSNWRQFYFSPIYISKQLTFLMHVKFIIKCITRYKK